MSSNTGTLEIVHSNELLDNSAMTERIVAKCSGFDENAFEMELTAVDSGIQGFQSYWRLGGTLFPEIVNGQILMVLPSYFHKDKWYLNSYGDHSYNAKLFRHDKYKNQFLILENGVKLPEFPIEEGQRFKDMCGRDIFMHLFYSVNLFLGQLLFNKLEVDLSSEDAVPIVRDYYLSKLYNLHFSLRNLQFLILAWWCYPDNANLLYNRVKGVFMDINPVLHIEKSDFNAVGLISMMDRVDHTWYIFNDLSRIRKSQSAIYMSPIKMGDRLIIYLNEPEFNNFTKLDIIGDRMSRNIEKWAGSYVLNKYELSDHYVVYSHIIRTCPGIHAFIHFQKTYLLDTPIMREEDSTYFTFLPKTFNSYQFEVLTDLTDMVRRIYVTCANARDSKRKRNFNVMRSFSLYKFAEMDMFCAFLHGFNIEWDNVEFVSVVELIAFYLCILGFPIFPDCVVRYISYICKHSRSDSVDNIAYVDNHIIWGHIRSIMDMLLHESVFHNVLYQIAYINIAKVIGKPFNDRIEITTFPRFINTHTRHIYTKVIDVATVVNVLREKKLVIKDEKLVITNKWMLHFAQKYVSASLVKGRHDVTSEIITKVDYHHQEL